MPDLDVISRTLPTAWRTPARLARSGTDPQLVSEQMRSGHLAGLDVSGAALSVTEALVRSLVEAYFGDPLRTRLMAEGDDSTEISADYVEACIAKVDVTQLAQRLLDHEDGAGMRAPTRRARRQSTEDLLHVPLGAGA